MEEVRRKQTEMGQLRDLLTALEALREHRKETRRKGERVVIYRTGGNFRGWKFSCNSRFCLI